MRIIHASVLHHAYASIDALGKGVRTTDPEESMVGNFMAAPAVLVVMDRGATRAARANGSDI